MMTSKWFLLVIEQNFQNSFKFLSHDIVCISFPFLSFSSSTWFYFVSKKKIECRCRSHTREHVRDSFFHRVYMKHNFCCANVKSKWEIIVCLKTLGAAIEQKNTFLWYSQPIWFSSQLLLDTFWSLLATICMFLQLTIYWSQFVSKCATSKQ